MQWIGNIRDRLEVIVGEIRILDVDSFEVELAPVEVIQVELSVIERRKVAQRIGKRLDERVRGQYLLLSLPSAQRRSACKETVCRTNRGSYWLLPVRFGIWNASGGSSRK